MNSKKGKNGTDPILPSPQKRAKTEPTPNVPWAKKEPTPNCPPLLQRSITEPTPYVPVKKPTCIFSNTYRLLFIFSKLHFINTLILWSNFTF